MNPPANSVDDVLITSKTRIEEAERLLSQAERLHGAHERTLRDGGVSPEAVRRALSAGGQADGLTRGVVRAAVAKLAAEDTSAGRSPSSARPGLGRRPRLMI